MITRETWAKVVSLSVLPAFWAAAAGLTNVRTAAVAMIAATIYVMGAKSFHDGLPMTVGFLLGIVFSLGSVLLIPVLPFSNLISTCLVLLVVVAIIVILQSFLSKVSNLFAWLCSYSVGMTLFGLFPREELGSIALQLAISMLVGVWFIGWLGQKIMIILLKPRDSSCDKES